MAGPDDLLADLPVPNPDEPFSLRQNIADELFDHLECAARRELLKNAHPQTVEDRVLARFGNPQRIARRLWLDAMQEILMTQKITLVLFSIVAVASLAACGLMWSLARDFQSVAADAQAASAKLLSQGQDTNAELLRQNQEMMQKLTALANRKDEPQASLDWIPLSVEILKADGMKTPAKGFTVSVRGKALAESEEISLSETTTEEGMADFGVVRPGYYSLDVTTPWNESHSRNVLVKPGAPHIEKVESPALPPKEIQVKPTIQWPKELEGKNVAVLVTVSRGDYTTVGEKYWRGGSETQLLIRPDGRFATYRGTHEESPPSNQTFYGAGNPYSGARAIENTMIHFTAPEKISMDTFAWNGKEAVLSDLKIVQISPEADFPKQGETLTCFSAFITYDPVTRSYGRGQTNGPEILTKFTANEDAVQNWPIEIPQTNITTVLAKLTPEQFPNLPAGDVAMGAWVFISMDKDGNKELSQEEFQPPMRSLRETFKEFPITFPQFIEAYVESRRSSGSSPFGRS